MKRVRHLDVDDTTAPYLSVIYDHVLNGRGRELRANYTWPMVQTSFLAAKLGIRRVSVIELGVGDGEGLVSLERIAARLEPIFEITIDVHGFIEGLDTPVGFISFERDLHTSTMHPLRLLETSSDRLLPRVHCYFNDILGYYRGEQHAIHEFNDTHPHRPISPIHDLRCTMPQREHGIDWTQKMFMAHVLDHPRYSEQDGMIRPHDGQLAA